VWAGNINRRCTKALKDRHVQENELRQFYSLISLLSSYVIVPRVGVYGNSTNN
jgi:hypothetical protein